MTTTIAFLGQFGDGVDFIFHKQESVGGGVQIGGPGELSRFGWTHLWVSVVAVAIAAAVATPLGVYLGHKGRAQFAVSAISNAGRSVPILALVAIFIAFIGVGASNLIIALALLAFPPIFTNAYVGANQVDPEIVDAANGMGMTGTQVMWKVRFPLAAATYFGGIRTSMVSVFATATIGPYASVRTLGEPILNQAVYGLTGAIGAAILVGVVTVLFDVGLGQLQRAATPKGVKIAEQQAGGGTSRRFSMSIFHRREQAT